MMFGIAPPERGGPDKNKGELITLSDERAFLFFSSSPAGPGSALYSWNQVIKPLSKGWAISG